MVVLETAGPREISYTRCRKEIKRSRRRQWALSARFYTILYDSIHADAKARNTRLCILFIFRGIHIKKKRARAPVALVKRTRHPPQSAYKDYIFQFIYVYKYMYRSIHVGG